MTNRRNRKEVMWSLEEMKLIDFASKYYGLDKTNTIRMLVHIASIELIAKCLRDGFPKLTREQENLIKQLI